MLWGILACGPPAPELVRKPAPAPEALLIRRVAVLDVETGVRALDRDVLVRGDRIAAIEPAGTLTPPKGAETIDGAHGTLLPGLIDAHGHITLAHAPPWQLTMPDPDANLRAYLFAGVTTVLDPADSTGGALERRDAVARGELLGPQIYAAGIPLTAPGGHPVAMVRALAPWWLAWYLAPRAARQVASEREIRDAIDRVAGEGADFLKVMVDRIPSEAPRLDALQIADIVAEARDRGLRTLAHIGRLEDALDAARAGVAAWVHGVYLERIPDEEIPTLARFGIPMVPTSVVFESYAEMPRADRHATALERQMVPREVLEAFNTPPEDSDLLDRFGDWLGRLAAERTSRRENVRRLHEAGVMILAGSDAQYGVFPGAGLHRELDLLAGAGLTPLEVIRAATISAARFLEPTEEPDFGRVQVGRRADLLLVEGDPTRSVAALHRIREVIVRGVRLIRTPLEPATP
ncbi:MAG: amidohydrolase family protein [Myxococcota bacterium]